MVAIIVLVILSIYFDVTLSKYPYPYPNGISPCDNTTSPPPIISFHVHAVFDGTNKTCSIAALNLYYSFIEYINPNMEQCPFSHPNSAGYYNEVCVFPFNATMDEFPFFISHIFGATDYAFFIPKKHYLISEMWWRQNYNPLLTSYMVHVNTGCEDNSHTIWSMVNENYPHNTNKTGLFCCHNGPPKCYCDITQYQTSINNNNNNNTLCIKANYNDNTIILDKCGDSEGTKYDDTTWRETYYNDTFIMLENFGTTTGNTYMCLGQNNNDNNNICNKGNQIKLVDCYQDDQRLNLFNYQNNKIKPLNCNNNDLCINYQKQTNQFILDHCANSTDFQRMWYRN